MIRSEESQNMLYINMKWRKVILLYIQHEICSQITDDLIQYTSLSRGERQPD